METEIIKTEDGKVFERVVTEVEIDVEKVQEELDGCLVLLEEQGQISERLKIRLENENDEEIKELIEKKINEVEENKRWNLIKITDLSNKLK